MARAFLPMIPADRFPSFNSMSSQAIDGQHDGPHDLAFGLDLSLDGLDMLRGKSPPASVSATRVRR